MSEYNINNAKNDIQNLQAQNSYDFQEIKRLDMLLKDYDKRILQAINMNNQINKKNQDKYEKIEEIKTQISLILDKIKLLEDNTTSGSGGSGLTITQTNQLNESFTHSQSYHVSKQEIPTKTSQLINDSDFVNSSYVNNAISNVTGDNSQLWSGKEASFLGDSITYGVRTTKKYHQYLKEYLGFGTVNNYGIDGSSITSHSNGVCTRYSNISSTSDIIFIFGGTNDFYYGKVLGEWYTVSGNTRTFNTDITTFKGALVTICKGLINKFPNKQIILMTPIHRSTFQNQFTDLQSNTQNLFLEDYVNVIKECGKIFSIPVIDLYSESGLYPADENNANLYFNPSERDLLHPNAKGHERIAQLIASKVNLLQPTTLTNTTSGTGGYRDVTEDDVTLINATLNIDSNGYKLTANKMWDGIRLNNIPTESKITLVQTNVGQCIWYMYKYDDSYMYVLSIGKGNGEHGKLYKMNISSNSATPDGTITMTTIPNPDDILKIVVSGTTQTLYCNDTELCTLTDCNTIGIANQSSGNNSYIASKWTILK